MKKLKRKGLALAILLGISGVVYAATFRRDVVNGSQIYIELNDGTVAQTGALKFGNDSTTPSMPTTTNAANFSMKVPVLNVGTAITQGMVLCSSVSASAVGSVTPCTTTSTNTVVGIADGAIAANAVGYMSVSGYALVLTTGTVNQGDVLVSSASATGYAGANNSPSSGTVVCRAAGAGTSSGGLTPCIKN